MLYNIYEYRLGGVFIDYKRNKDLCKSIVMLRISKNGRRERVILVNDSVLPISFEHIGKMEIELPIIEVGSHWQQGKFWFEVTEVINDIDMVSIKNMNCKTNRPSFQVSKIELISRYKKEGKDFFVDV